jgi:hypothetical protein
VNCFHPFPYLSTIYTEVIRRYSHILYRIRVKVLPWSSEKLSSIPDRGSSNSFHQLSPQLFFQTKIIFWCLILPLCIMKGKQSRRDLGNMKWNGWLRDTARAKLFHESEKRYPVDSMHPPKYYFFSTLYHTEKPYKCQMHSSLYLKYYLEEGNCEPSSCPIFSISRHSNLFYYCSIIINTFSKFLGSF